MMEKQDLDYEILSKKIESLFGRIEALEKTYTQELQRRISHVESTLYCCKNMLSSDEACMYLGVSRSRLYKMTCAHAIPYYKPRGKNLYFSKSELDVWLKYNIIKTKDGSLGKPFQSESEEKKSDIDQ